MIDIDRITNDDPLYKHEPKEGRPSHRVSITIPLSLIALVAIIAINLLVGR